jgi:acetolactate synthase-1/3 small subunit
MKKTISITAFNESGVLTRIATVFSSRGFNIDSIAVGSTETIGLSRITIVLPGNEQVLDQVIKQLNKLVQILEVKDVTNAPCVERELMLIQVESSQKIRPEIIEIAQIFRAKIVDISDNSIMMEITGDPGKTVVILELLKKYRVLKIARTGKIVLERDLGINTEYLKTL